VTDVTPRPVRTRFAPSPTGPLHIGGVRSALFGWLFARHHNGRFILRIEDTDQSRFVPGSLDLIQDGLRWLGINWDEGPDIGGPYGPYTQSERNALHREWAHWLVDNGKAYKCYCTPERLEQVNQEKVARKEPTGYDRHCRNLSAEEIAQNDAEGKSYVIRFKMPLDGKTTWNDLVLGEISFDNDTLQDGVLLKSDGFPTYHLAHVVDDHFMEISHVTRANEWLPSLPLHIQLWQAFGWDIPEYAHLPVLLNPNGKGKLSKRHAGFTEDGRQVLVLAHEFRDAGYVPEAVVNFLTNIGWNFGDDVEIFSVQEAIARFDLKDVHPNNSSYPIEKLDWLNGEYIRAMPVERLAVLLREPFERTGLEVNVETLLKVTPLVQPRIKTLNEAVEVAGFIFREDFTPSPPEELIQKGMDVDRTRMALEQLAELTSALTDFSRDAQEAAYRELATSLGVKAGVLFNIMRVATTGQKVSPPLFETNEIIGKAVVLERLQIALDSLGGIQN
jgi:glutamyl-tRNA synthetase